jgi:hypothetical protein
MIKIITSRGRARMIVRVVISSTTRVPEVSFSLSTLLRQPTTYLGPLLALTITETAQMISISSAIVYQIHPTNQSLSPKKLGEEEKEDFIIKFLT